MIQPRLLSGFLAAAILTIGPGCVPAADRRADIEATRIVRVGVDATYPPFEYLDSVTQEVIGFDADMARWIFGELGYEVEFVVVPFEGIIHGLNTGQYDAIISAFTITLERQEQVLFSDPYHEVGQIIAVLSEDTVIKTVDDLRRRRVGVQRGATGERLAMALSEVEVFGYDSIDAAFTSLETGDLDAVINDEPTTQLYIAMHPTIKSVGAPLSSERYGVAFRKTDGWLQGLFNQGLADFVASGEADALKRKYLEYDGESLHTPR
jgi:polar amino acid transport system substrate-binding protein